MPSKSSGAGSYPAGRFLTGLPAHGDSARTGPIENRPAGYNPAPHVTALVTGASRGIGRAIATELARTHQVIGTYRGRRDAAESLRADTGADIFPCDISSAADR